jgi:4'-phosphopantetheinyl transferase
MDTARPASPVVWSVAGLRGLHAIAIEPSEVVYAFVSLAGEPSASDEALLDAEEQRRSASFVHRADASRFVLAHAALRIVLARCLGIEPSAVRYESGAHGKPHLPTGAAALEFNLSHSAGVGLIAVARGLSVGVDVEEMRDLPDALEIAEAHFSPAERAALRSLPTDERRPAFFYCWTRKEAVIKATGEGLSQTLDSFDVDLAPGALSALKRWSGKPGATRMTVRDLPAPPGYAAAAAAPQSAGLRWRELSIEGRPGDEARR